MVTPTPCLMLMLNHSDIHLFWVAEWGRRDNNMGVNIAWALNSLLGPGHVSHYVRFWAESGNEVKMMHFNHLNEPAKTSIRNSIQVHCNMQLVFSGHTFRKFKEKIFLVEYFFSLHQAQKCPIYMPDFPHIQSPHSIKLSCSGSGWADHCAVRPVRAEQPSVLSSQSSAGCHSGHTWGARSAGLIELLASSQGDTRTIVTVRFWSFPRANIIGFLAADIFRSAQNWL